MHLLTQPMHEIFPSPFSPRSRQNEAPPQRIAPILGARQHCLFPYKRVAFVGRDTGSRAKRGPWVACVARSDTPIKSTSSKNTNASFLWTSLFSWPGSLLSYASQSFLSSAPKLRSFLKCLTCDATLGVIRHRRSAAAQSNEVSGQTS